MAPDGTAALGMDVVDMEVVVDMDMEAVVVEQATDIDRQLVVVVDKLECRIDD